MAQSTLSTISATRDSITTAFSNLMGTSPAAPTTAAASASNEIKVSSAEAIQLEEAYSAHKSAPFSRLPRCAGALHRLAGRERMTTAKEKVTRRREMGRKMGGIRRPSSLGSGRRTTIVWRITAAEMQLEAVRGAGDEERVASFPIAPIFTSDTPLFKQLLTILRLTLGTATTPFLWCSTAPLERRFGIRRCVFFPSSFLPSLSFCVEPY